jgi:hypothetical protein
MPVCTGPYQGGLGPTVDVAFFGFQFTANLSEICGIGPNLHVLNATVTEPNDSFYDFQANWGYGTENWTTPDNGAGFQWISEYRLTLLVAYAPTT